MRNHVLGALLCSISFCSAGSVQQKEEPFPVCASFERFLESFVGLFKKDSIVEGMEGIEEMTTNLLQTALDIIGGKVKPPVSTEKTAEPILHDNQLKDTLALSVVRHARSLPPTRATQQHEEQEDLDNQRKILTLFAGIVKNFFNIVQDPENRENVLPNLMGMATGIVEIGSEVIRSGNLQANATIQEVNTYVAHLDNTIKQAMLNIVLQKTEDLRQLPNEL